MPGDRLLAVQVAQGHVAEPVEQLRGHLAEVHEYDAQGRHLSRAVLEFRLPSSNKGLEGLSCIQRDGETFLLGLCEGNKCKSGAAGRTPDPPVARPGATQAFLGRPRAFRRWA